MAVGKLKRFPFFVKMGTFILRRLVEVSVEHSFFKSFRAKNLGIGSLSKCTNILLPSIDIFRFRIELENTNFRVFRVFPEKLFV